jgi:hypothetical protein
MSARNAKRTGSCAISTSVVRESHTQSVLCGRKLPVELGIVRSRSAPPQYLRAPALPNLLACTSADFYLRYRKALSRDPRGWSFSFSGASGAHRILWRVAGPLERKHSRPRPHRNWLFEIPACAHPTRSAPPNAQPKIAAPCAANATVNRSLPAADRSMAAANGSITTARQVPWHPSSSRIAALSESIMVTTTTLAAVPN